MKRVAGKQLLLGGAALPGALLIERKDALRGGHHMRTESVAVANGFRGEEAAAQHFGGVVFLYGRYALLALALKDLIDIGGHGFAQFVALAGIGCQQRGNKRTAWRLHNCLGEILEEVEQRPSPA